MKESMGMRFVRKGGGKGVEDIRKWRLGVGGRERMVIVGLLGIKMNEMAVVGKEGILWGDLRDKRMGIGERGVGLGGFRDVGNKVLRFNLIGRKEVGKGRMGGGVVMVEEG